MKKLKFFGLLLKQPLENTGAFISIQEHLEALQSAQESLMRTQEYSGALIHTHKYVAMVPWVLMSAVEAMRKSANACIEWSWVHLAPWRHAQETLWPMMAALGTYGS